MSENQLPLNQILQGNCIEVLKTLPENSIDLIFADPPYNLQLQNELHRPNMTKVVGVDDAWDQFDSFAAYDEFTIQWLTECRRVLKDTGTLWVIGSYHNVYRVGKILMDLGYWILNDVLWLKTNPMPNFRGVRFTNAHETLLWTQKRQGARYTFNHQDMKALNDDLQMRNDWLIPLCGGPERIKIDGKKAHATQKPEALLYRVIASSSNAGEVVLDPFFGSGTTGAVAKKLHRHWIGIEQDAGYIEIAQARLEAITPAVLSENLLTTLTKKSEPRLPFGNLLEQGLLQPGQMLYFHKDRNLVATILVNGHLKYQQEIGSIHQMGRVITKSPCNGWEHWYYHDAETNQLEVIDKLREQIRAQMRA